MHRNLVTLETFITFIGNALNAVSCTVLSRQNRAQIQIVFTYIWLNTVSLILSLTSSRIKVIGFLRCSLWTSASPHRPFWEAPPGSWTRSLLRYRSLCCFTASLWHRQCAQSIVPAHMIIWGGKWLLKGKICSRFAYIPGIQTCWFEDSRVWRVGLAIVNDCVFSFQVFTLHGNIHGSNPKGHSS